MQKVPLLLPWLKARCLVVEQPLYISLEKYLYLRRFFKIQMRKLVQIVGMALLAPAKFIAADAGVDGDVVVEKILSSDSRVGCNAMNGRYEDLMAARVIDPCRVSRCALQNAVSIAGSKCLHGYVVSRPEQADFQRTCGL